MARMQPTKNQDTREYKAGLRTIGINIRNARAQKGMNQRVLATRAGLSQSRIAQFERRFCRIPLTAIYNIAKVLGVPPDMLLRDGAFPDPPEAKPAADKRKRTGR